MTPNFISRFTATIRGSNARQRIGFEHPRRFGPAVEPEVKRVARARFAGEDLAGAALAKIAFGPRRQLAADPFAAVVLPHEHGADNAGIGGNGGPLGVGAEPGMHEADHFAAVAGDDQPVLVEIGLREDEHVERVVGKFQRRSRTEFAEIPEFDELRRIGIVERPVLDQCRLVCQS
jgi:hypothetical protein